MQKYLIAFLFSFCALSVFAEPRSFDMIFPDLPSEIRTAAFSDEGYIKSSEKVPGFSRLETSGLDPRISEAVLGKQPGFLTEALLVIPKQRKQANLLDVYNALGKIQDLKGRLYHSRTKDEDVPLFEDATRIESAKKYNSVPDPGPAASLPSSETVYLRLKDANFGNSYYRGDMALDQLGLRYCLSNYKNLTYFLIPVIKEEKFTAQLYFEPIDEGILIYSIAGADVSDFVSSKIDIPSAITKRLAVIISWAAEGILGDSPKGLTKK
jgi:hypothetical protein